MKKFLAPLIIVLIIASVALGSYISSKTHFNDTYVNGNTAGNLYNNGLFCEANGKIYFSNPSDNGYLYEMTSDGQNVKKLYEDKASFINADENYLYYVRNNVGADTDYSFLHINTNSLCRYDLKRKKVKVLETEPSLYASLIGNYIYYIHYDTETASTSYRVKIDGSEREQWDKNPYFTCSTNGQYLYYNGLENDHNIYQMNTENQTSHVIYNGNCWQPVVDNNNIYFMDCEAGYALSRLSSTDQTPQILNNSRIECFNVYGNSIYFQTNGANGGEAALCRMDTDGNNVTVIQKGNFTNINVTSRYVYFSEYGKETTVYKTPTNGDGSVTLFTPPSVEK